MEGETRVVSDNSGLMNVQPISVLVVDDDTTCLSIVAAKLRKFQYHVVTVKHPNEALCTLRVKVDAFDLVVSDIHMPDLSGIQLQQVIAREFNLPVVLMSADKKEDVVLEGLESGAAFYISKPVCTDDLKDLWQFAVTKKKKSQVVIEETESPTHEIITSSNKTSNSDAVSGAGSSMNEIVGSTSSVDEIIHDRNKDSKRKSSQSSGKGKEISETVSQKKQKVVWTSSLHNRFLEAITSIGFDRAVPKEIVKVMNVPSLTRENVASHLQKYRICLRRTTEKANLELQRSDMRSSSRTFSPNFTPSSRSSSSSLFLNNLTSMYNPNHQTFPGAKNSLFLNREGSSRDILGQSGFGQSRLLSGGTMPNLNVVGTSRTTENESTRLVQNFYQNNALFLNREGLSRDILGQSGFGQSRLLSRGGTMPNPYVVVTNQTTENESTRLAQNFYQNITPVQGNISGAFSPHFNPLVLDSTPGVNLDTADYGFSNSYINDGIINPDFNSLSSTTAKDSAMQTNFVGLNISNVQHLLAKSERKKQAFDGRINNSATGLEFQNNTTAGIGLRPNESPAINVEQMDEDKLFNDFLAGECQMLMDSNVYELMENLENGLGKSSYDHSYPSSYSPMFDLDELISLPLDEQCNLNPNIPTSTDQAVNLQNQVQEFDNVSFFDQVMNVQSQVQPVDDAFMESLLAPGLFEEDFNIEGL